MRRLNNLRVAVLVADGFEKVELTVPVAALRAAGAHVFIVSLRHGRIRGVNLHEPASRTRVDMTVDEAANEQFDALLIPGGFINPDLLRQSEAARLFVTRFNAAGLPIATLCHGPWVLASAELLLNRTLTSWPGIRDDLVHAGATWLDEPVVRDRNWITSRGPQDLASFVPAMLQLFAEQAPIAEHWNEATESSPQRAQPPAAVVNFMRWMPRPSFRTAFGLAAIGVAVWALQSRKGIAKAVSKARSQPAYDAVDAEGQLAL
jgi:protease I